MSDLTQILHRLHHGEASATGEFLTLVYDELRKLAPHKLVNEAPGQTLQPTALVHEAWLRPGRRCHAELRGAWAVVRGNDSETSRSSSRIPVGPTPRSLQPLDEEPAQPALLRVVHAVGPGLLTD